MTHAERLREEGRRAGQEEGRVELALLVLRLLAVKFNRLPERYQTRVRAGRVPDLARWGERVVTAASVDEVFSEWPR